MTKINTYDKKKHLIKKTIKMYPILCYTRRQKGQYNKLMYSSASRDNTYLDVYIHLYI